MLIWWHSSAVLRYYSKARPLHSLLTDELLQDNSGDYFIPEHFFYASPPADSDGDDTELHEHADAKPLYALGRAVERMEVRGRHASIMTYNILTTRITGQIHRS